MKKTEKHCFHKIFVLNVHVAYKCCKCSFKYSPYQDKHKHCFCNEATDFCCHCLFTKEQLATMNAKIKEKCSGKHPVIPSSTNIKINYTGDKDKLMKEVRSSIEEITTPPNSKPIPVLVEYEEEKPTKKWWEFWK